MQFIKQKSSIPPSVSNNHFFWETSDRQERLNGDWGRPVTLERQLTTGNRLREKAEAKCHCGKICKNQRGLKIHQSRSGCSRGIVTEQRTDLSGETQENPSQDTNHSARNLSASVTFHDSSQSLNDEEPITQQRQETSHQKERIAWPKMNSEAQWRNLKR
ncbi:Hypothetical predicted protein [Mytilus galloprovincialis]|uniref:Uncharacterized protein n=1 Tax=Mytilus galloprovincialis TaxID=29158 RepID=A0A8B6CC82_MYTGA|nr:Hypothetical predicted protein [Mytilus galloprovincialis]